MSIKVNMISAEIEGESEARPFMLARTAKVENGGGCQQHRGYCRSQRYSATRLWLGAVSSMVGMLLGLALIRVGLLRGSTLTAEDPSRETCQKRFNSSYDDIINEMPGTSQFCAPPRPNCMCANPLKPSAMRLDADEHLKKLWISTHARNMDLLVDPPVKSYDVILYGDSITEHWQGTDLGGANAELTKVHDVYEHYFSKATGAHVEGLALGIGGDRCPQLLYRLQNGELPDNLHSKVFWVLIGTNDLGGDHCSVEAIVAGTIRIAMQLRELRPHSKIVLNSVLPRGMPGEDLYANGGNMWRALSKVNQWMECYANENRNIEFFNATGLFLRANQTATDETLYMDPVHPSPQGHSVLGHYIVKRVLQLIS